ncbi:MAG: hypothetical protein M9951_10310 [Burkholderiaceae bacterium]|nr:hypothetical protein [Burkholderiaceae bacterium]
MNRAVRMAVAGAVLVGLVAILLPAVPDPDPAEPGPIAPSRTDLAARDDAPPAARHAQVAQLEPLDIGLLRSRHAIHDDRNPFRMPRPEYPQPIAAPAELAQESPTRPESSPPPVARPQPAPAHAAGMSFSVIGRVVERGKTTVFLANGDRHYSAQVGDVIDGKYRVDAIEGLQVTLRYLPDSSEVVVAMAEPR